MFTLYYSQGYQKEESGTFDVIGSSFHPLPYYRPFIQLPNERVDLRYKQNFLIFGSVDKKQLKPFESVIDNCTFVGNYQLTDKDLKSFEWAFPDFSFKYLGEYYGDGVDDWKTNDIFFPSAADTYSKKYIKSIFDQRKHFMKFVCENKKYKDYFDTSSEIFFYDSEKTLPTTADECEKLFDKDVLEIKKLVNDIGQPTEIPEYEQINLGLYDESAIIEETYIQRINRQIQLYGLISIPFAHTKKSHLISLKNLLPFRVSFDVEKNHIIFELSYLEEKKKFITNDKKIHNLSIICVENEKQMSVVEKELTIEALQAFDKYQKLNPIDIKITDSDLFRELTVVSNRRIKYKFIPNTILLSSSVQQETEVIFLTVTGLNEAKDILINGKMYKAIGCIYTNEIEGWDQIKKITSNWVACKLSNSKYPFGAKHLGFEFITDGLKALIDFTLYLIDQNGNEITFAATEEKTPSLNFTIQIIS